MAFATQTEIDVVNQALDRLHLAIITLTGTTDLNHIVALRHFYQIRDSLMRSYEWPWLTEQAECYQTATLLLEEQPTSAWAVDDVITGITNGYTATILTVTSNTEYEIIRPTGDFEDGETITNATVSTVYWEGIEVEYEDEIVYHWDSSSAYQSCCDLTQTALEPNHKWSYQYELPSDFVRLINIDEDDGTDWEDERWVRQGTKILTDYETLNIDYVKSVSDPDDWDSLFTELFILTLALKLCAPLAGLKDISLRKEIKDELQVAEAKARSVCSQEDNQTGRSDWNLARYT